MDMVLDSRLGVLVALVAIPLAMTGCATVQSEKGASFYRESATDVVDRAPASMAIPPETSGGDSKVIDDVSLRTTADTHFTIAESYSLEGDSVRAIEEYKLTLVYDPSSPRVRLRLAAEYVKQGLISEAIEQCKAALEIDTKHEDARLLLGGLYSALRMYDDSLKEYRTVLANSPTNMEAPLFIGAILAEQKKFNEAAQVFQKLAKDPENTSPHVAWYYLGRVRLEENKEKNAKFAETAFKESLTAKPNYVEALLALGGLYEATKRKEKAIQLFQAFQDKSGPRPSVADELSRLYIEEKNYQKAYEQLAVIEAEDKTDVNVKAKMAFILIEETKYQEAILRLEEVLALEPSSDKIRFYLGAVYEEVKDYPTAISHFKKVPLASSYFKESTVHTSYLYKLLGDYDKAIDAVEEGIKVLDDHPPFYALLASLLDDTKQFDKAVKMLTSATEKFPENAQLKFFLGSMQDRTGDKQASMESMKKVIAIDGEHVQALNFLAYVYADQGKNLDEAEKLVRRAMDLQPEDGYILDTYGWVLFKKGRTSEAIRVLEAAYKIQPEESIIAEHLGDAYYHEQMPEKAKRLYMRAAELETNVATSNKIKAKIVSVDRQIQTPVPERKPASSARSK